jgi:UDP-N-acetylmuramate--alanine ligase
MNERQTTHFIGIGGTGLSAIARVLVERGENVTGSDREDSPLAKSLRQIGVTVNIGHVAGNVNGATRVIRSSAVGDDNVEVQAAHIKGVPVYKRSEFLGELLANQQVIAVAGSHGKTTTTAMIAWMLTALNQNPGYIIGSVSENLGTNAAAGAGRLFVIEADEYDHMFLGLDPKIAVVTNVEHDHPDLFPEASDFQHAFEQFVDRLQPDSTLIACDEDTGAAELLAYARTKSKQTQIYSQNNPFSDYWMEGASPSQSGGFQFSAMHNSKELANINMQIPGVHNALNALVALAVADLLGLSVSEAAMALSDFRGTARRFEERGVANGVIVVDDYAHHPTEIRSTLIAAKTKYQGHRIWTVWQPHTYSRTLTLQHEFEQAFHGADLVLVTGVYAAREQKPTEFDMDAIVKGIKHKAIRYVPTLADTRALLLNELQPGDVLIVMSAGDAIEMSAALFESLKDKEAKHA